MSVNEDGVANYVDADELRPVKACTGSNETRKSIKYGRYLIVSQTTEVI